MAAQTHDRTSRPVEHSAVEPRSGTTRTKTRSGSVCTWTKRTAGDKVTGECCIAACIENRAMEVGMAVVDLSNLTCYLHQYVECSARAPTETVTLLGMYQPDVLLKVSNKSMGDLGCVEGAVRLQGSVLNSAVMAVPRGAFNDSQGLLLLQKYSKLERDAVNLHDMQAKSFYLALASLAAVMRYIDIEHNERLVPGSLEFSFGGSQCRMHMDMATIDSLEVVQASGSMFQSQKNSTIRNACLLGLLSRFAKTKGGKRLLRMNLLQPLTDIPTIYARYDAVEELIGDATLASTVDDALAMVPSKLEDAVFKFGLIHRKNSSSEPSKRLADLVASILDLRDALQSVPVLCQSLEAAKSVLLRTLSKEFGRPELASILESITSTLDENAQSSKLPFVNKTQHCFAVACGVDGFLDVARKVLIETTDAIYKLFDQYKEMFNCDVKLSYTSRRGFYLTMPRDLDSDDLPEEIDLTLLDRKGKYSHYCTQEIASMNMRLKDAMNDCYLLTEKVIDERIHDVIRLNMGYLQKLCESVSLLDLLCACSCYALETGKCTRPELSTGGPHVVENGKHPILLALQPDMLQPNSLYLSDSCSTMILHGPNMSGKSTLLKQTGLLSILAQVGCFVPADFASFRVLDRIHARMGAADSIEMNSSSFMVEMQELNYIVRNATEQSLVLIDELGRATSTADGAGISWAVVEHFLSVGCLTVFATHMTVLSGLTGLYPNCAEACMQVSAQEGKMKYSWKVATDVASTVDHYGICLAEIAAFPPDVILDAKRALNVLRREKAVLHEAQKLSQMAVMRSCYSLKQKILLLKKALGKGEETQLCRALEELRIQIERDTPDMLKV